MHKNHNSVLQSKFPFDHKIVIVCRNIQRLVVAVARCTTGSTIFSPFIWAGGWNRYVGSRINSTMSIAENTLHYNPVPGRKLFRFYLVPDMRLLLPVLVSAIGLKSTASSGLSILFGQLRALNHYSDNDTNTNYR